VHAQGDAADFHGPMSLHLSMGFAAYAEHENLVVVRPDRVPLSPGS